jgi:hypothetical protein
MPTTPTLTDATEVDLKTLKIFDMVDKYNMSLIEIFQKTDYTVETAYSEVVALILVLSLTCQISEAYGFKDRVLGIQDKITELYIDWIELSGGKFPISEIEQHPEYFKDAIEEMKRRLSKQKKTN